MNQTRLENISVKSAEYRKNCFIEYEIKKKYLKRRICWNKNKEILNRKRIERRKQMKEKIHNENFS